MLIHNTHVFFILRLKKKTYIDVEVYTGILEHVDRDCLDRLHDGYF